VATEAAWLNGDNLEKEEINEAEREKKRKDERKVLTLTGLLMEGVCPVRRQRRGVIDHHNRFTIFVGA
jgi:hypothetical protein